jgi:hypothetical protein
MLTSAPAIAFVPSTDLDRSRRFFADVLGLPVVELTRSRSSSRPVRRCCG